ncbi:MAG: DUF6504 family protein [Marmoricola sp.]
MRRYDDPVDVRKGQVHGSAGPVEGPEQFLWRGRLWQVRDVVAHWVETGPWWQSAGVRAVLGSDTATAETGGDLRYVDPLHEREVWRVEAARGRAVSAVDDPGFGVFDLVFDWASGSWRLSGCAD